MDLEAIPQSKKNSGIEHRQRYQQPREDPDIERSLCVYDNVTRQSTHWSKT